MNELIAMMEQLLALLDAQAREGHRASGIAADGVRIRLAKMQHLDPDTPAIQKVTCLLDAVPDAKDLDAIGFRLDRFPEVRALRSAISIKAAAMAQDLLGS